MDESIKSNRPFSQLGLPPMELAESSESGRSNNVINKCILPLLQKVMVILILIVIGVSSYILLFRLLGSSDNTHSKEIIVITTIRETPNITVHGNELEIILLPKNKTLHSNIKRKKRHANVSPSTEETLARFKDNDFLKARDIIMKHDVLCKHDNQKEICKDLVMKLKGITENSQSDDSSENKSKVASQLKFVKETTDKNAKLLNKVNPTDIAKRETHTLTKKESYSALPPHVPLEGISPHSIPYSHSGSSQQLTDTCLLARLLKQKHPSALGIYDVPASEYIVPQHDDFHHSVSRYFMPPGFQQYLQSRDVDTRRSKMHPQDFDIFMSFLTPRPETSKTTVNQPNSTVRMAECPAGTLPCGSGDSCVMKKQWCDGKVDCPDVSDELTCGCKSRVDKSRLCDGYFDCPFGEDEMGCYGCAESSFSCGDLDINSMSTCFLPDQRCNNVIDCPNHRDEIECNMLAPSLHKKPLYAISNTEGYLHRNFKGKWYAVCKNPYMWAHDACRRETGHITRPPIIQVMPIDPLLKVSYLNSGLGGLLETSDNCFNSSAVYVTCPELMCGTRISSTSQLLRENSAIENHMFGRNKRFLITNPYPMMFYSNRMKRHVNASSVNKDLVYAQSNEFRKKRTESRVVGGKPSQPTAWPWMVAIYRNGMFHCGGVVVSQSWIMSAAHCVHKFWDHYYEIQVGMLRRFSFSPQEQNHKVTHVIVNQYYSQSDMKNDLSLLRVDPAIQYSRWVRPICLPNPDSAGPDWLWGPSPGTICTAVGWGATKEHGSDPDHMREVEVPIWEKCKHREDRAGNEICAGFLEGGKDACQGDSGGPLLCRNPLNSQQWYMAGIVSHGDGCARKDEPGVYTRVSLFVKWIRYHIFSKTLPIVQPILECPGFKCESGISKCLPTRRKCDKIIDCLDGEDEINCNDMRSSSITNHDIFLVPSSTTDKENYSKVKEAELESNKSFHKTSPIADDAITSETHDINITTSKDHKHQLNSREIETTNPSNTFDNDFNHPSTVEISKPSLENDYGQLVTEDPSSIITSEETNEVSRGDMQTISISISKESLESRSSVLKTKTNSQDIVEVTKSADIEDDWTITEDAKRHSIESTTTMTTLGSIFESTTDGSESIANGEIDKKFKKIVIDFHPNSNSTLFINTVTESINDNKDKDLGDQTTPFNNNKDEFSSKKLTDFEDKKDIINKIEDIVFSELQPALRRRKHRIPQEFQCQRIYQNVPYKHRCDHKADCEDGTDELGCTCTDYLVAFDEKLICDGIFDCADGQDETDCYKCADDQFLCRRSKICLPVNYVCDGKPQCPEGEDELDCFALSNGKEMLYGFDERPKVNLEGYLTKKHNNEWHVLCEDKMSIEQQEQAATHICRYLGFSSANRYYVKYLLVNEKEIANLSLENQRKKREARQGIPIHFAYREVNEENDLSKHIVIKEPQMIKEHCVPNITKTCQSLYVFCDHSLFTNFNISQNFIYTRAATSTTNYMWPWIAKIYVEGEYKCTGNLLNLSWVLISQSCLWDTSSQSYITAVFGSYRTLVSTNGLYEQIQQVDAKKDIYTSKVTLLHLKEPVNYTNTVKPMVVSFPTMPKENNELCVAVGQDNKNNTINVFLEETNENCNPHNRCFVRRSMENICSSGGISNLQWAGIISCHSEMGWYPAASFVDSRGECGLGAHINGSYIHNLKNEIGQFSIKNPLSDSKEQSTMDDCEGTRCGRGRCTPLHQVCDGIRHCENGNDESSEECKKKKNICGIDPYHKGCECSSGQLKCRNGRCVSKELFSNGRDDCGDGTDEPGQSSCSAYLSRVMPSKLCDGILHCHDRSDEDPMFCKCFAKRTYKCGKSSKIDHCVAPDMVCDGIRDCPNGEDERTCIALNAPEGTPYGTGQVIVRSHGVWHSKCYTTQKHTKSELEAICRELGFISGHAKKVKEMDIVHPHNNLLLDQFSEVALNNNTIIKMRNSQEPIANPVFDQDLQNCYPVFIECL